jgi:hypothetical protein
MIMNIEDCLEYLVGLRESPVEFTIEKTDHSIMTSIARQTFRETALTDRQFALMKEKLQTYRDQFTNLDWDFDYAVGRLRQPLRTIDRSRWIRIVDDLGSASVYESHKGPFIAIRFTFQKKLISSLEHINKKIGTQPYHYDKINKIKYYEYNEKNLYEIVTAFKDKNFVVDDDILNSYNTMLGFKKEDHVPGIYNFKFLNLHPNCEKELTNELGTLNKENILVFKDRSLKYGLNVPTIESTSILTKNIANRDNTNVFVNSTKWTLDQLVSTLVDLDRFPLVILLDELNPFENLVTSHAAFRNIVTPDQISVQFRLSSENSHGFNEYIKENGINSPVDKNTKVVYTSIDKLNKPLITSDCRPNAAILLESRRVNHKMQPWLNSFDLVMHYDSSSSQFMRFQKQKLTEV